MSETTKDADGRRELGRTAAREAVLDEVEQRIGHRFEDRGLLDEALTHRSFLNEAKPSGNAELRHNERLEFLGDAVLGLVAAEKLFLAFPEAPEGELTRARAAFVSETGLSEKDGPVALAKNLRLGRGQAKEGGAGLPSLIADATEAVVGAVFLDGGLSAAQSVVKRLLGELELRDEGPANAKSRLQERVQPLFGEPPGYEASRIDGPDHAPRFEAKVSIGGQVVARGAGANKKEATVAAAERALAMMDTLDDDEVLDRFGGGRARANSAS